MKKTYEKPVVVSKQVHTASEGACGKCYSCGELVRKN